jgi:hypothetical protein
MTSNLRSIIFFKIHLTPFVFILVVTAVKSETWEDGFRYVVSLILLLNDLDKLAFDQFDVINLQERLIFMD